MNKPTIYAFREARTIEELESLLRLRYSTFQETHPDFYPIRLSGLEVDTYDAYARHFGLFADDVPVGYVRVVCDTRQSDVADDLEGLLKRFDPSFLPVLSQKASPVFPVMGRSETIADTLQQFIDSVYQKKETISEGGRLCILPDYQKLHLASFFIKSLLAIALFDLGLVNTIISCQVFHQPLYEHFGFQRLQSVPAFQLKGWQEETVVMHCHQDAFSIAFKSKLQAYWAEYKTDRQVTLVEREAVVAG